MSAQPDAQVRGARTTVHLVGGPYVTIGAHTLPVPEGSKRLLAFVALRDGRVERRRVAGTLWPDADEARAAGNLRSCLWRLRSAGIDVIECDKWALALGDGVRVDALDVMAWADRVSCGRPEPGDLDLAHVDVDALDLLPGWHDDWTIVERERFRQRVLHALESQSRLLSSEGRHGQAVDIALSAIRAEPLRESARRTLIEAYLGEDNLVEATRTLSGYQDLLDRELGVSPSPDLVDLVQYAARRRRRCDRPRLVTA